MSKKSARRRKLFVLATALLGSMVLVNSSRAEEEPAPAFEERECRDEVTGALCLTIGIVPGDEIDWDGPDYVRRSFLDFSCFDVEGALANFSLHTAGIASRVPAANLSYDQAIANVRAIFESGEGSGVLTRARADMAKLRPDELAARGAVSNDMTYGLAALFAGHEAKEDDPSLLFSLAGALTQRGMPNEALAMLDKIRTAGSMPEVGFAASPAAALDYLRGYAQLMTGQLQQSRSLLAGAFAADPTLTDASYALAVADAAIGNDPRKPMLEGYFPAYSGELMYCGDKYDLNPTIDREEEEVAPPADKLLDLSKGTFGVLPQLRHPTNGQQLLADMEEMAGTAFGLLQQQIALNTRASALYARALAPRFRNGQQSPQDETDRAIVDMLDESKASLKPLQRMRRVREQRGQDVVDTIDRDLRSQRDKLWRYSQIADVVERRAEALGLARDIVLTGMTRRRTSINGYDMAAREHFRNWHRYATGLVGYITDDSWREYAELKIQEAQIVAWHSLYVTVVSGYGQGLPNGREIYPPDPGPPLIQPTPQPPWRCSEAQQNNSVEVEVLRLPGFGPSYGLSASMNCDKQSLEADAIIAGINGPMSMGATFGGFIEASRTRAGDYSLFAGPKASVDAGVFKAGVKDGLAATWDSEGIKEIAFKVEASVDLGGGGAKRTLSSFDGDSAKFTIWAAPPRPPKFDSRTGLMNWRNN
jgi:hypothetical protein